MTNSQWLLLVGSLLLAMGLTSASIKRSHLTSAIIYLAVGMIVGPTFLNLFHFNPLKESALLEILTEVAVLISLFAAGVKMPVPFTFKHWRAPILLASVSMTVTVGIIALFGYYALGLPLGAAVLLGAIVAPTDPVLATDVQIRHPGDSDRLRFNLTCEAGMNDGSAFPFVMLGLGLLGLHDLGDTGLRWVLVDVLWSTIAGIGIGVVMGALLAHVSMKIRSQNPDYQLLNDFLGLGLIGVVYGMSELFNAWGFLAVFFAAVALRQTELKLCGASPDLPERLQTDQFQSEKNSCKEAVESNELLTVSEGSLVFKEHLERFSELLLVLMVGGSLFIDSWSWRAVSLAIFLFVVARPVSVFIALSASRSTGNIRAMVGWFGVRGIGSLYYLMYAIQHGLSEELALELIHLILIVVTLSIFFHGISVKPMMKRFWTRRRSSH